MMQWASEYGIPAAIAVAKDVSRWIAAVQNSRSLFYWWVPEATFIQLAPRAIALPRYKRLEWAQGNQRTAPSTSYVNKAVSSNFRLKAPKVHAFISKMNFDLEETQDMLFSVAAGAVDRT